jgi:hypothetical protein
LCIKSEEHDIATKEIKKKAKLCLKQKSFSTYSADDDEKFYIHHPKNISGVRFFLAFTERIRSTNHEVLIFSSLDLLSSLGGSLGLFIGFSFFGYVSTLFDAAVDKCSAGWSFKR